MARGTLWNYETKHREHATSVWSDRDVAILTIGAAGCSANIHLNAEDCRAIAIALLDASNSIGALKEAA